MSEHAGVEDDPAVDDRLEAGPTSTETPTEPRAEPDADRSAATTGHPAVDEVVRSLDTLAGRPVDEHVAAFEQAHDSLRRALSHAGDDTP